MKKTNITMVFAWYAPYRLPLLREIARHPDIRLTVIYCSHIEQGRKWHVPEKLPFKAVFLKNITLCRYRYRDMFGEGNSVKIPLGLIRAIRDSRPDIVVGYEFRVECMLAGLFSSLYRYHYITWSDVTKSHDQRMGPLRIAIRRLLLSRSKALIGSSSDTIDHFHHTFGYPRNKSFLSILSAHVDDFTTMLPQTACGARNTNGKVSFLYVGRFIEIKGLDLLITAFAELKKKSPSASLTLIGDGPERDTLKRLASDLGYASEVTFKSNVPHKELPEEMVKHDVFVLPSRLDVFGLALAEAVACHLPSICSRYAGAARDLIDKNGIIVDPYDTPSFVSAMEKLVSDRTLRLNMSEACIPILRKHNLSMALQGVLNAVESARN